MPTYGSEDESSESQEEEEEENLSQKINCVAKTKGCIYPASAINNSQGIDKDIYSSPESLGFCTKEYALFAYSLDFHHSTCRSTNAVPCFETVEEQNICKAKCNGQDLCSPLCYDCERETILFENPELDYDIPYPVYFEYEDDDLNNVTFTIMNLNSSLELNERD